MNDWSPNAYTHMKESEGCAAATIERRRSIGTKDVRTHALILLSAPYDQFCFSCGSPEEIYRVRTLQDQAEQNSRKA